MHQGAARVIEIFPKRLGEVMLGADLMQDTWANCHKWLPAVGIERQPVLAEETPPAVCDTSPSEHIHKGSGCYRDQDVTVSWDLIEPSLLKLRSPPQSSDGAKLELSEPQGGYEHLFD